MNLDQSITTLKGATEEKEIENARQNIWKPAEYKTFSCMGYQSTMTNMCWGNHFLHICWQIHAIIPGWCIRTWGLQLPQHSEEHYVYALWETERYGTMRYSRMNVRSSRYLKRTRLFRKIIARPCKYAICNAPILGSIHWHFERQPAWRHSYWLCGRTSGCAASSKGQSITEGSELGA